MRAESWVVIQHVEIQEVRYDPPSIKVVIFSIVQHSFWYYQNNRDERSWNLCMTIP